MKRVIATNKRVLAAGLSSHGVANAVSIQHGHPANDVRPPAPAMLDLVDDLATLAVKLYRAGRLASKSHEK